MTRLLSILLLFAALSASAATRYVWSGATGANNGTSWSNAYTSISSVASAAAGDIIYVGAGSYSGLTLNNTGTAANPIRILAAQDTHTGVATFSGDINGDSKNYIVVDGSFSGSRNFDLPGVSGAYGANNTVKGCYIHGSFIGINWRGDATTRGGLIQDCLFLDIRAEAAIDLTGRNIGNAGYDNVLITNCIIQVNSFAGTTNANGGVSGDGNGPDGIQGCWGATIVGNVFSNAVGQINNNDPPDNIRYQHQDLIQMEQKYIKIIGNKFVNGSGDSCIDYDAFNGQPHHHIIANNVFIMRRGSGIRYYAGSADWNPQLTSMDNIYILNNTFVDHLSGHQFAFHINNLGTGNPGNLTVSSMLVQNNIFVNCLSPIWIISSTAAPADFGIDYNLINAGANGNTTVTVDGASYTQAHPRTALPAFNGYTPTSALSDLSLNAADTAAIDQGTSLSAYITNDFSGVSRPQGAAWDIGAYEYSSGSPSTNPVISLSLSSISYGWNFAGTSSNKTVTVQNVGQGTLSGTASASAPWSISGTATYSLTNGQSTNLTVTYSPTTQGIQSGTVSFTGGGGGSVAVDGIGYTNQSGFTWQMTNAVVTSPMIVSNGYIVSLSDSASGIPASGYALFGFATTSNGYYQVKGMVNAPGDANNSFYFGIDSVPVAQSNTWDVVSYTTGFQERYVSWRGDGAFDAPQYPTNLWYLTAGNHYGVVFYRENSTSLSNLTLVALVTNTPTVAPFIITQPDSTLSLGFGESGLLTVVAGGTPAPTYQWQHAGTNIVGETAATYEIATADTPNVGVHTCIVSNSAGVVTTTPSTVTVEFPPVAISGPPKTNKLWGTTMSLSGVVSNAVYYLWYKDGSPLVEYTSATLTITNPSTAWTGNYSLYGYGRFGGAMSPTNKLTILNALTLGVSGNCVATNLSITP